MADYAAQAASIYDPQSTAEQAQLDAGNTANQASFATDTNTANSAYTDAITSAGKARDTASANDDFTAQTHGLWSSGLAANAQRLTYQNYVDNASKISLDRAQKLTDIGNRQTAATQKYQADKGVLASKYSGLKNSYIIDHQDADAKAAAANAARIQAAQIRASSARQATPSAAATRQADAAALAQSLTGVTGKDGHVSPNDYAKAKAAWVNAGYASKDFDNQFSNFVNQGKLNTYTLG